MYCIQYDEICKKHNFELEHDAHGDGVSLKYPAGLAPKYTLRLSQNHLPEEVSAMAEKYGSDRFAVFMYNATAAAGNTISLAESPWHCRSRPNRSVGYAIWRDDWQRQCDW